MGIWCAYAEEWGLRRLQGDFVVARDGGIEKVWDALDEAAVLLGYGLLSSEAEVPVTLLYSVAFALFGKDGGSNLSNATIHSVHFDTEAHELAIAMDQPDRCAMPDCCEEKWRTFVGAFEKCAAHVTPFQITQACLPQLIVHSSAYQPVLIR